MSTPSALRPMYVRVDITTNVLHVPGLLGIIAQRDADVLSAIGREQPPASGPGSDLVGTVGLVVELPLVVQYMRQMG